MALFSKETPPARPAPLRSDTPIQTGATFIGPNVTFEGTLSGSEPIVVEGSIRGRIDLSADLRIGTKARVEADVHARNLIIEGKLTGDASAAEKVELIASATVEGNIKAPKIVVAEGAKFRGSVDMGSSKPQDEPATAKPKT